MESCHLFQHTHTYIKARIKAFADSTKRIYMSAKFNFRMVYMILEIESTFSVSSFFLVELA